LFRITRRLRIAISDNLRRRVRGVETPPPTDEPKTSSDPARKPQWQGVQLSEQKMEKTGKR
jgi:hypothetical protein